MKRLTIFLIALSFFGSALAALAVPIVPTYQGGTGIATTTGGNAGNCFYAQSVNASGVIVYGFTSCGSPSPATTTINGATGPAFTFATSGPLISNITGSGNTVTFTTIPTSTILAGYVTSSNPGTVVTTTLYSAGYVPMVSSTGALSNSNIYQNTTGSISFNTTSSASTITSSGTFYIADGTAAPSSFSYPTSTLTIVGNHRFDDGAGTLSIADGQLPQNRLYIGYDHNNGFAYLQSTQQMNFSEPLILNPDGGRVSVGFSAGSSPNSDFQVDHFGSLSGTYGSSVGIWLGDADNAVGHLTQIGFGVHTGFVTVPSAVFGTSIATLDGGGSNLSDDFVWAQRPSSTAYNSAPVENMRLTANGGFLGLHTTNPSSTLHVIGSTSLVGSSTLNGMVTFAGSSTIITPAIGGAIVGIGCDSATSSIDSSYTSSTTAFVTTPRNSLGSTGALDVYSFILSPGVMQTNVCSDVTLTPVTTDYVVKIIK